MTKSKVKIDDDSSLGPDVEFLNFRIESFRYRASEAATTLWTLSHFHGLSPRCVTIERSIATRLIALVGALEPLNSCLPRLIKAKAIQLQDTTLISDCIDSCNDVFDRIDAAEKNAFETVNPDWSMPSNTVSSKSSRLQASHDILLKECFRLIMKVCMHIRFRELLNRRLKIKHDIVEGCCLNEALAHPDLASIVADEEVHEHLHLPRILWRYQTLYTNGSPECAYDKRPVFGGVRAGGGEVDEADNDNGTDSDDEWYLPQKTPVSSRGNSQTEYDTKVDEQPQAKETKNKKAVIENVTKSPVWDTFNADQIDLFSDLHMPRRAPTADFGMKPALKAYMLDPQIEVSDDSIRWFPRITPLGFDSQVVHDRLVKNNHACPIKTLSSLPAFLVRKIERSARMENGQLVSVSHGIPMNINTQMGNLHHSPVIFVVKTGVEPASNVQAFDVNRAATLSQPTMAPNPYQGLPQPTFHPQMPPPPSMNTPFPPNYYPPGPVPPHQMYGFNVPPFQNMAPSHEFNAHGPKMPDMGQASTSNPFAPQQPGPCGSYGTSHPSSHCMPQPARHMSPPPLHCKMPYFAPHGYGYQMPPAPYMSPPPPFPPPMQSSAPQHPGNSKFPVQRRSPPHDYSSSAVPSSLPAATDPSAAKNGTTRKFGTAEEYKEQLSKKGLDCFRLEQDAPHSGSTGIQHYMTITASDRHYAHDHSLEEIRLEDYKAGRVSEYCSGAQPPSRYPWEDTGMENKENRLQPCFGQDACKSEFCPQYIATSAKTQPPPPPPLESKPKVVLQESHDLESPNIVHNIVHPSFAAFYGEPPSLDSTINNVGVSGPDIVSSLPPGPISGTTTSIALPGIDFGSSKSSREGSKRFNMPNVSAEPLDQPSLTLFGSPSPPPAHTKYSINAVNSVKSCAKPVPPPPGSQSLQSFPATTSTRHSANPFLSSNAELRGPKEIQSVPSKAPTLSIQQSCWGVNPEKENSSKDSPKPLTASKGKHSLADYQMQLKMLEEQNAKRKADIIAASIVQNEESWGNRGISQPPQGSTRPGSSRTPRHCHSMIDLGDYHHPHMHTEARKTTTSSSNDPVPAPSSGPTDLPRARERYEENKATLKSKLDKQVALRERIDRMKATARAKPGTLPAFVDTNGSTDPAILTIANRHMKTGMDPGKRKISKDAWVDDFPSFNQLAHPLSKTLMPPTALSPPNGSKPTVPLGLRTLSAKYQPETQHIESRVGHTMPHGQPSPYTQGTGSNMQPAAQASGEPSFPYPKYATDC